MDESNGPLEEWKVARSATDKFDGIVADLRKYSFTFITGLATAQGIFGLSGGDVTPSLKIGAILATMTLVVASYWLDRYYFGLLWGTVVRTTFIEKYKLKNFNLSSYISGFASSTKITSKPIIPIIYFLFLLSLLVLGLFVVGLFDLEFFKVSRLSDEKNYLLYILIGGSCVNVAGIVVVYWKHNVEDGPKQKCLEKIYEWYDEKSDDEKQKLLNQVEKVINKILNLKKSKNKIGKIQNIKLEEHPDLIASIQDILEPKQDSSTNR